MNYDTGTGNRTRATLVEGECSHHCTIPAPPLGIHVYPNQACIFSDFFAVA